VLQWHWRTGETDAPADWQFPDMFKAYGLEPSASRRADYVRYELLKTNEDVSAVLDDALGNPAPITDGEVDAALSGFPVDDTRRADTGRAAKRNKGR